MISHTPGPWKWEKVWQSPSYEVFWEMCHIANVYGAGKKDKANARLIAAAPELVDKLGNIIRRFLVELADGKLNPTRELINTIKDAETLIFKIDGVE